MVDRRGDRLLEVELLEELDDADRLGATALPGPGAAGPSRSGRGRVPRWVWAAGAVLVGAAVAGGMLAGRAEDAALADRLADVAGLSVSLDGPLTETWRVPAAGVLGAAGGSLVTRWAEGRGVSGVDAATGAIRWTRDGSCELVPVGAVPAGTRPAPALVPDRPDDLVVCVEELRTGGVDDGHVVPVAAHVLDPVTGDVLRSIELGPRHSWSTVGSDLVTLGIARDGHAEATRWSLVTGERRWTYRSPEVLPPNDSWGSSVDATVVELDIGAWTLALDADTGVRIPRVPARLRALEAVWGPLALPDGASAISRFDVGGLTETTVRDADGSTRVTVPGLLLLPTVDDGSVPGRLLVVRPRDAPGLGLVGVDPVTGASRWTSPVTVGRAAVVQGLLLVRDGDALTALDGRTGQLRWSVAAGAGGGTPTSGRGLVTDGRQVLELEATPSRALVARDVTTGATTWTRPAPADDASLAVLDDGTVLVVGGRELVALGAGG